MNKLTLVADKFAELNRRRAYKRQLTRLTKSFAIESPATLAACDEEIAATEKELKHIELVSNCQILDFPALDFADKLGPSLIESRQALDWSQNKLAEKIGLTRHHVSRYERNQYKHVKLQTVARIAAILRTALAERRSGSSNYSKSDHLQR
jgi:DNA-binding XRE family transcriptional regulator